MACFSRRASSLRVSDFPFHHDFSEHLCEIHRDNLKCEKCMCNDLKVMRNLLVTALIIALLLVVSGNVELNPGPMKKCLKCEKMMPTGSNNSKCGYLLCYVAVRVLHFRPS